MLIVEDWNLLGGNCIVHTVGDVLYIETLSTCSLMLLDGTMRLFQSVALKQHPCSLSMLSLVHCLMVAMTSSALLMTDSATGAHRMGLVVGRAQGGLGGWGYL